MNKIALTCAVILGASLPLKADSIRLSTGKYLTGQVSGFTNGSFQVEFEKHGATNLPAQSVLTIDFEDDSTPRDIESSDQTSSKGRISLYDKGAFSVEDEHGEVDRIPLQQIAKISFGTPASKPAPAPATAPAVAANNAPAKKAEPKPDNVVKIEQVTDSDLAKHVVRGKVTIVDFYADWCGPCRSIGPHLEELTQKNNDVVLRRVNIDQNRDLASKFGIVAIPNIIVYDKTGNDIGKIRGANPSGVDELVAKAQNSSID